MAGAGFRTKSGGDHAGGVPWEGRAGVCPASENFLEGAPHSLSNLACHVLVRNMGALNGQQLPDTHGRDRAPGGSGDTHLPWITWAPRRGGVVLRGQEPDHCHQVTIFSLKRFDLYFINNSVVRATSVSTA